MNPIRAETRCQDRNRDDPTAPQTQLLGNDPHDVAITLHIGAADIENAARGLLVSAPARYPTTFLTAIGWYGVLTHLGVIITGNRSTKYRRISNDAEPEPAAPAVFEPAASAEELKDDTEGIDVPRPIDPILRLQHDE